MRDMGKINIYDLLNEVSKNLLQSLWQQDKKLRGNEIEFKNESLKRRMSTIVKRNFIYALYI